MVNQNAAICKNNSYPTTIHCINSCLIKLSKLTKTCPLFRGTTNGALPDSFFVPDKYNIKGGIEFGFTSMTTEKAQAAHYAKGKAAILFEADMGLVDRFVGNLLPNCWALCRVLWKQLYECSREEPT